MLLLPAIAAAAECPTSWSARALDERLASAESTYAALDMDAFQHALQEAKLILPCVSEPLPVATASRYHRIEGIRLFLAGDEGGARTSLLASRVIDPAYRFPDEMFDAAHALRVTYETLPTRSGPTKPVSRPRKGRLLFDGTEGRARPTDRATILQVTEPLATTYLLPNSSLPTYDRVPGRRVPMLVASAVAVGAAGALYGLAWGAHDAALDPDDAALTRARQDELQEQTVIFTVASGGALVLGAGFAVVGILP